MLLKIFLWGQGSNREEHLVAAVAKTWITDGADGYETKRVITYVLLTLQIICIFSSYAIIFDNYSILFIMKSIIGFD